ncbi:hypothetical protein HMPREF0542_11674 [Ligilactobacillus ruminis ATCC 25644]|uniref:Uncharacterized protein n=1 Tax=Ligilactobacillus ruminis ATCC 25644 TaxID=525362 RepID=E7FRZ7_9LACO|nr:hypothetical protein HMPREF0542_11674 [Ligilactobacillus ruminis ATCC 25644]
MMHSKVVQADDIQLLLLYQNANAYVYLEMSIDRNRMHMYRYDTRYSMLFSNQLKLMAELVSP